VGYTTEGITHVRLHPLVLDVIRGEPVTATGAIEVTWDSTQGLWWHQVYVNGRLAGVTPHIEDRRLVVSGPVGCGGMQSTLLVEVIAVDAIDRWTDFGDDLSGLGQNRGLRVRLAWQGGLYLDPNLESFDVFADGRTGVVDYASPLNESPIPAKPGGQAPWGFGCGGYGFGAYGQSAARYEWTTDVLEPGTWRLAVVAVDAAGNRLATTAEIETNLSPPARPPENFRVASYDPQARTATLAWQPSPDV
jgi:hypothetical protein